MTAATQGTGKGLRLLKSPQNPDCVFFKMVLNQNPALKYPNTLSVSIQIQSLRWNFFPETNENHPMWQIVSFQTQPYHRSCQALKTVFCHTHKYLAAIFCSYFFDMRVWQRCKRSMFFMCVISEPQCIHSHWKVLKQQQHLYRENAELAKTEVALACSGESLHLPLEPELIISFYFCFLAGSWANPAGSCTDLLALQE